jgi:citrate lyase subunit beta/citryl-CoA lyase
MSQACSYLFVPGNRPDRFDKARASGAHRVIVDLEDAVPEADKAAARTAVAAWLGAEKPVLLRLNRPGSQHWDADCPLVGKAGIAGVVIPKVEDPAALLPLHEAHPGLDLFPMIESARGLAALAGICAMPGCRAIIFGSLDFALDIHATSEQALLLARSRIVLESRLAGIDMPVDGVSPGFQDLLALEQDAKSARELGFGGKTCIHPRQVPIVNRIFSPTEEELAWARRVVDAAAAANDGAVAVDGSMVDLPLILRARAILEIRSIPESRSSLDK